MTSRVLVADDSLTIQKVINITLVNSGYEIVECLNEQDLLNKVESNQFDLILLDFNLSDKNTGYELSKTIKSKNPSAAILVMLGTFDSVDESQFAQYGINDKIVKPFESSKFIKKCKDAIENRDVSFDDLEVGLTSEEEDSLNLDSWTMDAPSSQKGDDLDFESLDSTWDSSENIVDPLTSEIQGWGFAPDSLESQFKKEFPSEIEDYEATSEFVVSKLMNSSDFNIEEDSIELSGVSEETSPGFDLSSLGSSIEEEIKLESSEDDFWAIDDNISNESEVIQNNLHEITADLTETVKAFKNSMNAEETKSEGPASYSINTIDEDALVEKIKNQLKPMLEEMIKHYCSQQVERVAWEVIPDLAENLIKKEIKEISESVQTH